MSQYINKSKIYTLKLYGKQYYKNKYKKILAISLGGLGDTILFSPVLKALCRSFPNTHVELLVGNQLALEVYSCLQEISHISLIQIKRKFSILKAASLLPFLLKTYLKGSFNVGIFATGLNPKIGRLLKYTGVVKEIIYAPTPRNGSTDLDCNVILARTFDKRIDKEDVFIPVTTKTQIETESILKKHDISLKEDRILAIYPSIELAHRPRWELSKLIGVIQLIKEDGFQGKIVVVGGQSEGKQWEAIDKEKVVDANLAGKLSILSSAALLNRCSLAVGNDGGLMHVAGAVGCPMVVIMPNTPLSYRPPGKNVRVIHSKLSCCNGLYPNRPKDCKIAKCIADISTEEVFRACISIVEN